MIYNMVYIPIYPYISLPMGPPMGPGPTAHLPPITPFPLYSLLLWYILLQYKSATAQMQQHCVRVARHLH